VWKEFKEFAMRGNVVDMAVGIIIGAAFSTIVNSLVNDIIMPPIGLILGKVDFSNLFILLQAGQTPGPYTSLADAKAAGAVTMSYGVFVNAVISFVIVAFVLFMIIKGMNQMRQQEAPVPAEPTTKDCPYCLSKVPIRATRCAFCTSDLSRS
jgi:large conductance mechanosensitive channel